MVLLVILYLTHLLMIYCSQHKLELTISHLTKFQSLLTTPNDLTYVWIMIIMHFCYCEHIFSLRILVNTITTNKNEKLRMCMDYWERAQKTFLHMISLLSVCFICGFVETNVWLDTLHTRLSNVYLCKYIYMLM